MERSGVAAQAATKHTRRPWKPDKRALRVPQGGLSLGNSPIRSQTQKGVAPIAPTTFLGTIHHLPISEGP